MLFATGGGIKIQDEIKLVLARKNNIQKKEKATYYEDLEKQFQEIKKKPTFEKSWQGHTYKWWASHLPIRVVDDLKNIKAPIYFVHGTKDESVPVESADLAFKILQKEGKLDIYYVRLKGVGHSMRGQRIDIFGNAFKWLDQNQDLYA